MRRILVLTAAASLLLAGCGGSDSGGGSGKAGDIDSIKVSDAKEPKVSVAKGFGVSKTESKVVSEGSGEAVESGDSIKINYVGVNGTSGKQFDSTFTNGNAQTISLEADKILPGFLKGLADRKVGSRVLVAIPPADGFGDTGQPTFSIKKTDTMVFLFDIVSKVPNEVTGTSEKLPADVPQLTLDGDKHPSGFTKTGKTTDKISKEALYTVIKGKGPKLETGQTLRAQYVGQVYPDGDVFDESWSKQAATFPVGTGGLIKCWDDQLIGQTIGSRVVLVCPADKAYGDSPPAGGKIKKGDTLIFAIDLLDATAAS